jgi:MICOS complex subunit MIC19
VASELERLSTASHDALRDLIDKVASETATPDDSTSVGEKIEDAFSSSATLKEKERKQNLSREVVQKEVEKLRQKLDQRKGLKEPDEGVLSAKNELVACLRINDRRPLDCWQEVENFRNQVGRLEKEFVQKTVR